MMHSAQASPHLGSDVHKCLVIIIHLLHVGSAVPYMVETLSCCLPASLYQAHKGALILRIFGALLAVVPLDLFSGILATTVRTGPNTYNPCVDLHMLIR